VIELFLLRHVDAVPAGTLPDAERPLTEEARSDLREAARAMHQLGFQFELILSSPLRRAVETAEIVREATGGRSEVRTTESLKPDSAPHKVYAAITAELSHGRSGPGHASRPPRLLLVGHQPLIGEVCSDLIGQDAPAQVGKGTLIWFEMHDPPPRSCAKLKDVFPLQKLLAIVRPGTL